jgi:hypothetical protein
MIGTPYSSLAVQAYRAGKWQLYKRYGRKYQAAMKVGSFLYKNRNKIKQVLRRRTAPGVQIHSKAAANSPAFGSNSVILATLTTSDLPWPLRGADGTNFRDSNLIYVKGIKICRQFEYDVASGSQALNKADIGPIVVHWCLLQLKNDEGTGEISSELPQRFFRDNSQDGRTRDFNNAGPVVPAVWDMAKNCLPINPNDKVRILTRKKKTLIARGGGQNNTARGSYWKLEKYYPVKKRFNFAGANSAFPSQRIFEVFWYEAMSETQYPQTANTYVGLSTCRTNQLYFKDTI